MKKIFIVLLSIVGIAVLLVVAAATYIKLALPNVGDAPEISVERTPERIQRGEYLANHITVCMDCHSTRDWSQFAGPLTGELGVGGEKFSKEMGFPGTIYSPNITPHNLEDWTDGDIYRAITTGVNKKGEAMFPVMPYHDYGKMDEEDIFSIIAYVRSLKPVATETPERELDFPVSVLVNTMPVPANLTKMPDKSDRVSYGQYLVNASGCVHCHSQVHKGVVIPGTEFGGGREFAQPAGILRTPNITPHPTTGIGSWTSEVFVHRFKMYVDSSYQSKVYTPNDLNTIMPWVMYAGMDTADLEAIYLYLKSVQPIDNHVDRETLK